MHEHIRTKMARNATNDDVLAELSKVWDMLGEGVRREWVVQAASVLDEGVLDEKDRFYEDEDDSDFPAPVSKTMGLRDARIQAVHPCTQDNMTPGIACSSHFPFPPAFPPPGHS